MDPIEPPAPQTTAPVTARANPLESLKSQVTAMLLASCGAGEVRLSQWPRARTLARLPAAEDFADAAWTLTGDWVVALARSGTPSALDLRAPPQDPRATLDCHRLDHLPDRVTALACSKAAEELVCASTADRRLLLCDLAADRVTPDGGEEVRLPERADFLEYACRDAALFAAVREGRLHGVGAGGAPFTVPFHSSCALTDLKCHRYEALLMVSGADGSVHIWDANRLQDSAPRTFREHTLAVNAVDFDERNHLGTAGADGLVALYDLRAGLVTDRNVHEHALTALAFGDEGRHACLVGTAEGTVFFYDRRRFVEPVTRARLHTASVERLAARKRLCCVDASGDYVQQMRPKIGPRVELVVLPATVRTFASADDNGPQNSMYGLYTRSPDLDAQTDVNNNAQSDLNAKSNFSVKSELNAKSESAAYARSEISVKSDICTVAASVITNKSEICSCSPEQQVVVPLDEEFRLVELMVAEVQNEQRRIVEQLVDRTNDRYLKMRIDVSRMFCAIEQRDRRRWNALKKALQGLVEESREGTRSEENEDYCRSACSDN